VSEVCCDWRTTTSRWFATSTTPKDLMSRSRWFNGLQSNVLKFNLYFIHILYINRKGSESSQIFYRDTKILSKWLRYEKYCRHESLLSSDGNPSQVSVLLILWSLITTSMEERERCYSLFLSWTPHKTWFNTINKDKDTPIH
jgi:hypothetical protein